MSKKLIDLADLFERKFTKKASLKVYVVLGPGYVGDIEALVDIFSSREKAMAFISDKGDEYEVHEWEVK